MKKSVSIWLLALILLLFFSAEVFYSFFYPENNSYFVKNEKGKIAFNTALLGDIYKNYSSVPYNYCSEFKAQKVPGVYRIFLIGEASMAGWPYSNEQSAGKKISFNLSEFAPGKKFEVITISFAGFNSFHALDIVPQVFSYEPDLIILYSAHNEFYGYKGSVSKFGLSKFLSVNILQKFLLYTGINKSFIYDNKIDDLELMLPLCSDERFIYSDEQVYKTALNSFEENISRIAEICKENKTGLILTELTDNNLLPPIGISNLSDRLSADIIFNNARMALMRDGNEAEAEKLFIQSKELDAFRLRIPVDFSISLENIAKKYNHTLAEIPTAFSRFSQNHIPGNDLLVDYIHPNLAGLDIISAEYSRLILKKFSHNFAAPQIEDLLCKQEKINKPEVNECRLEKNRIERSSITLRNANLSQKIAPASLN